MAQKLAGGNGALALLCNTLPTGAILVVLILMFGPLSGAHFNPAVSLAFALARRAAVANGGALHRRRNCVGGVARRVGGASHVRTAGVAVLDHGAHRSGTVAGGSRRDLRAAADRSSAASARRPDAVPYAVGLYITAAYWFTASTSFANPAVTIARSLSDTFAGIAPGGRAGLHRGAARGNARSGHAQPLALARANVCLGSFSTGTSPAAVRALSAGPRKQQPDTTSSRPTTSRLSNLRRSGCGCALTSPRPSNFLIPVPLFNPSSRLNCRAMCASFRVPGTSSGTPPRFSPTPRRARPLPSGCREPVAGRSRAPRPNRRDGPRRYAR